MRSASRGPERASPWSRTPRGPRGPRTSRGSLGGRAERRELVLVQVELHNLGHAGGAEPHRDADIHVLDPILAGAPCANGEWLVGPSRDRLDHLRDRGRRRVVRPSSRGRRSPHRRRACARRGVRASPRRPTRRAACRPRRVPRSGTIDFAVRPERHRLDAERDAELLRDEGSEPGGDEHARHPHHALQPRDVGREEVISSSGSRTTIMIAFDERGRCARRRHARCRRSCRAGPSGSSQAAAGTRRSRRRRSPRCPRSRRADDLQLEPTTGDDCRRSSASPCGRPSTMSIRTTSARPRSTTRIAVVCPTNPLPTTVTRMEGRLGSGATILASAGRLLAAAREVRTGEHERRPQQETAATVSSSKITPSAIATTRMK